MGRLAAAVTALFVGYFFSLCATSAEDATSYPSRSVTIVVPFPAGGAADIVARLVSEKLQAVWRKPVLVENIAGAAGITGTARGLKSQPDGYTITLVVGNTTTLLANLRTPSTVPYAPLSDYDPIALFTIFPNMLVMRPQIEAANLSQLTTLLRNNPRKFTFGSSGIGSSAHIAGEWFKAATKTDILHVPFTGSSQVLTALLGGHIDMSFDTLPTVLPSVQAGKLRAVGVGTFERVASVPEVPAIAEFIPGFDVASWDGFVVPKGTPFDIRTRIAGAVQEIMVDTEIADKFKSVGAIPQLKKLDDFRSFLEDDYEKWKRVVQVTGITLGN
jgi:tripartite-type tricarboxylate transporter receptor subunit TctC